MHHAYHKTYSPSIIFKTLRARKYHFPIWLPARIRVKVFSSRSIRLIRRIPEPFYKTPLPCDWILKETVDLSKAGPKPPIFDIGSEWSFVSRRPTPGLRHWEEAGRSAYYGLKRRLLDDGRSKNGHLGSASAWGHQILVDPMQRSN